MSQSVQIFCYAYLNKTFNCQKCFVQNIIWNKSEECSYVGLEKKISLISNGGACYTKNRRPDLSFRRVMEEVRESLC